MHSDNEVTVVRGIEDGGIKGVFKTFAGARRAMKELYCIEDDFDLEMMFQFLVFDIED